MNDCTEDGYRPSDIALHGDRFVIITGCSGGGKSSLLAELARRGCRTFPEAGRQIVREQDWTGGDALPWTEPVRFCEMTVSRALFQLTLACAGEGLRFFDRGPIDQLAGLEHAGLPVPATIRGAADRVRYNETVFVAPPWPEIFAADAERRHGFDEALAVHAPLCAAYRERGYRLVELPRVSIAERADFVLGHFPK
ncbi:MAG: AAA family ATPase [Pseudomonadota bacterium]